MAYPPPPLQVNDPTAAAAGAALRSPEQLSALNTTGVNFVAAKARTPSPPNVPIA